MAEYIEREAAMQAFLAEKPDAHYPGWYAGLLEELPAADVAPVGWFSVKDKLPEPEQDVLVIAHGWSGRLLYIGSYQRMEAETSWLTGVTSKASEWSLWGWSYLREPEVTHWMPLPEPPMSARMDGEA